MMFLNPIMLLGLAAASIPIVLHLLNLRKLKTIEFSTLTFLKELQRTKIHRLKIRQILLLILRTLFVVLVVLAFSRPTLKGTLSSGFAKTTALIIVDDSYSMTTMDEQGELIKQAKRIATRATEFFNEGDQVFLLKLSDVKPPGADENVAAFRSFAELRSAIQEIKPTFVHRKLDLALRQSADVLGRSMNFNKEVYVISDFQSGVIERPAPPQAIRGGVFPPETRFFLSRVGGNRPRNASIDAVTIPNTILEPGKPFSVIVKVTNHNATALNNALVSVFASGVRVAQKGVTIESGKSADVELSVVPKTAGIIEGMATLEEDDLEFDNRRYFTVTIPKELHVLIVGNPADIRYISLALATRSAGDSSSLKIFESTPAGMTASQISWADAIILSNVRDLTSAQHDRIRGFLLSGGGLIVFPGSTSTPSQFNLLASSLRIPRILSLEENPPDQSQSFLEIDKTDVRHPLFVGMFEDGMEQAARRISKSPTKALESPRVRTFVRYASNPQDFPVITLSNGAAFLLDQKVGSGRVLLFSVAANLEWSDFPLKGLFVPLLHRSVSYLAQQQSALESAIVGDPVALGNIRHSAMKFSVYDPRKNEFTLQASLRGLDKSLLVKDTFVPGIYQVKSGAEVIRAFSVNVDPDESKTEKADDESIQNMMARFHIDASAVRTMANEKELAEAVTESRYGLELWKHLLIAALIVALVEMLVSRETKTSLAAMPPKVSMP